MIHIQSIPLNILRDIGYNDAANKTIYCHDDCPFLGFYDVRKAKCILFKEELGITGEAFGGDMCIPCNSCNMVAKKF